MWEIPQYAKVRFFNFIYPDINLSVRSFSCPSQVHLDDSVTDKHPRYGLYLYGEGQYFEHVSKLELEGAPVLYIPGNGGSMKQVCIFGLCT